MKLVKAILECKIEELRIKRGEVNSPLVIGHDSVLDDMLSYVRTHDEVTLHMFKSELDELKCSCVICTNAYAVDGRKKAFDELNDLVAFLESENIGANKIDHTVLSKHELMLNIGNMSKIHENSRSDWGLGYKAAIEDVLSVIYDLGDVVERASSEEEMDVVGAAVDAEKESTEDTCDCAGTWCEKCSDEWGIAYEEWMDHFKYNQPTERWTDGRPTPEGFMKLNLTAECTCTDPGDPRCDAETHRFTEARPMTAHDVNPPACPDFFGMGTLENIDTEFKMTYEQSGRVPFTLEGLRKAFDESPEPVREKITDDNPDAYFMIYNPSQPQRPNRLTLEKLAQEFDVDLDAIKLQRLERQVHKMQETVDLLKDLYDRSNGNQK